MTAKQSDCAGNGSKNPGPPIPKPSNITAWFNRPENLTKFLTQAKRRFYASLATQEDREDAAQCTAIGTWEAGRREEAAGKELASPLGMGRKVGRRHIATLMQSLEAHSRRVVGIEDLEGYDPPSSRIAEIPHRKMMETVLLQEIDLYLETLPLKKRIIYMERVIEGIEFEEIAANMALPLSTVKTLFYRTRADVCEHLTKGCCFPQPCKSNGKCLE